MKIVIFLRFYSHLRYIIQRTLYSWKSVSQNRYCISKSLRYKILIIFYVKLLYIKHKHKHGATVNICLHNYLFIYYMSNEKKEIQKFFRLNIKSLDIKILSNLYICMCGELRITIYV